MTDNTSQRPLIAAGTLLGIGMGGFVDGILFHQLLQIHNMLTAKYPKTGVDPQTAVVNIEINMFWDGMFHALTWVTTAAGLALLWRAVQNRAMPLSTKTLIGSMLFGWGVFNLVEGIINHHILHLHHVTETDNHLIFDLAFLASGVVFIAVGSALIRAGCREPVAATS